MKSPIEIQQYRRCILLFLIGITCSIVALLIHVVDPVKMIVQHKLKMSPTSLTFSIWQKPPIAVYVYVYIFNVTNTDAFLSGEEKLKIEEIGPFVYQEILENQNVTWHDNGTLTYIPKRSVEFKPEMSIGIPEEIYVSVPNIVMLGVSSALHDAGFLVNYPFIQLSNFLDAMPILNITVQDYLWGYDDPMVYLAGSVVPKYITFRKFGLLDRMYDEGTNVINMNVKGNEDMLEERGRYLSIESYNGNPGLSIWGYVKEEGNQTRPENTKCNRIQGATEGTVFPTMMDRRAVFRVFRKAFCRPMPIAFVKEVNLDGLPGYQYGIPDNFADPPEQNPDNECFCRDRTCLKRGLLDLTPCYYNIPAAASLPHFLNADPSVSDGIEGLNPDPEKHETVIILQPNLGIPMYVHSRLQTNLMMKETYYNSKIKPFNNLTVPLFWTDLVIPEIPPNLMFLLRLAITIAPVGQTIFAIVFGVFGLGVICWSLARAFLVLHQQQQEEAAAGDYFERRDSTTELRIPLGYGPYTSIRILPAIKKITSKTDLFM
ncbi:scavenger receptor class B member 1 [Copidosoma floridanum]|uniref:scavenger receptor class B member 1 n=1 Tax=Copidosoma floridanum TaxID=29053 RepID=UPI0006C99112|nr:scavenger receptor class B member 1 [Copidosoma floridanum]XP_014207895.1 scavenger receptor class B member 1 [Copidosoma floridanum]